MITGTIYQENWTDSAGNNKTSYEVSADSIGLTAYTITKQPVAAMASSASNDPWSK
jgi:single-stranded DNA-binding protein